MEECENSEDKKGGESFSVQFVRKQQRRYVQVVMSLATAVQNVKLENWNDRRLSCTSGWIISSEIVTVHAYSHRGQKSSVGKLIKEYVYTRKYSSV